MPHRFLRDLRRFGGRRLIWLFGLTLAAALTDGIGLLLLVPLLELVGAGAGSGVGETARRAFEAVGVSFTLGWMLAFYVALVTVRALLVRARTVAIARFQLEFVDWQRMRVIEAVTRATWITHLSRRTSDVVHTVLADLGRVSLGTHMVFSASTRLVVAVAYVAVAVRLSPSTTALAGLVSVALAGALWPLMRKARRIGGAQTTVGQHAYASLSELLASLKLAKVHGTEEAHLDELRHAVDDVRGTQLAFQRTQALATGAYSVATAGALALLVWIGVEVIDVPTTHLLALIVVLSRILPIPGAVADDLRGAANMLPAYEHAMSVMDDALAAAERPVVPAPPHPIVTGIELDEVRFTYPDGARPAVAGVSLHLPSRATTALVGPSGAGKTTLADIVLGLITPDAGEVRVDGRPLAAVDLGAWRAAVSYVPQDPFLFNDTLRANVAWGTSGCSDALVTELLSKVGLAPLVSRLPDGLDTLVGERGVRLSGGERQRVVLARSLARRPQLLVLDEATSHLDSENEQTARAAVDALQGELTVLVIAHRLGTVRHADQIVVLDEGRVVERGHWDELVSRRGRFSELLLAGEVAAP